MKKEKFNKSNIHPQYITDTAGKKLVILPQEELDYILDEIERLELQEDILLYEQAKKIK